MADNPQLVEVVKLCQELRRPLPLILAWTLGATAIVLLILRLYIRIFVRRAIGWDDYTMTAAVVGVLRQQSLSLLKVS